MKINVYTITSLCTVLLGGPLMANNVAKSHIDTNGYPYKNEETLPVTDKRKIAILSYGSLVRQKENLQTKAVLESTEFTPTTLYLPVSLLRQSKLPRLTAAIDRNGDLKRVWAATSQFTFLPNARNNLAAREGSKYFNRNDGYNLTNIFYMKKLLPEQKRGCDEKLIPSTDWVIRLPKNKHQRRHQLPESTAQEIAQWADENGYTAVMWAAFPPNVSSQKEAIRRLLRNNNLLKNTQDYVKILPDGPETAFEQAIMTGKEALRSLLPES